MVVVVVVVVVVKMMVAMPSLAAERWGECARDYLQATDAKMCLTLHRTYLHNCLSDG